MRPRYHAAAMSTPRSIARGAALLGLCLSGLVAITWARVGFSGTLRVDGAALPVGLRVGLGALWFLCSLAAMRLYLRAQADLAQPPAECAADPLRPLLWCAVALHVIAALALPYSSNDIFSNLGYARMLRLGLDPYLAGPAALPAADPFLALVDAHWRSSPSIYGPVALFLNALASRANSVASAVVLFKLGVLATSLATVFAVFAICRRHLSAPQAAPAFVFFAWNPLFLYELSGEAHNDGVMVLFLVLFIWAALCKRELVATLFLALAFLAKFAVAPVLGLYLALLLRRSPVKAICAALLVAFVSVLLFLPYWHGWRTVLGPLAAISADPTRVTRSYTDLLCLAAELFGPVARLWTYRVCWALGTLLLAALGVRALVRARTLEAVLHESLIYLLACALIAVPWYLSWYESWLLPLAFVDRDPRLRRLVAVYTALSVIQWCINEPALQAAVINTTVLVLAVRYDRRGRRLASPSRA